MQNKIRRVRPALWSFLFVVTFIIATCNSNGEGDDSSLKSAGGVVPFSAAYQGFTFYPDGYANLSWVTYYPVNITDAGNKAWAKNSSGATYGNITWTFTRVGTSKATIRFDYITGDYEIYTLYDLLAPTGYTAPYYYTYVGYTGGRKYEYNGSWSLDATLGSTHGLVLLWAKTIPSYVDISLNGQHIAKLYSNQFHVHCVPFGTYSLGYAYAGNGGSGEDEITVAKSKYWVNYYQ